MNALKLSLAGALGFAFACVLVIGSVIFTGSNVMIEKKFTVSAQVDGGPVNVDCSTVTQLFTPTMGTTQVIVQGYGHRNNVGYVGRAIVAVHRGWSPDNGRTESGYYTMLNGFSSYRGEHSGAGNDKVASEVTGACLGNINMMKL